LFLTAKTTEGNAKGTAHGVHSVICGERRME